MFLIYRGSRELAVGLLPALIAGINELIKMGFNQDRPYGTCLTSKGMPSSHSAVAVGLFLYLVLDAGYRLKPSRGGIFGSVTTSCDTCMKMIKGWIVLPFNSLTQREFFAYVIIWAILLLPVPLSRVLLNDHSPSQAMAGTIVGFIAVCIWFPLVLWMRSSWRDYVGQKYLAIFVHNYDVPEGWRDEGDGNEVEPIVNPPNKRSQNDNIV